MSVARLRVPATAPWAASVGYSRAIRVGDVIEVSGTTAIGEDGEVLCPGDPYGQTRAALAIVERALVAAGGGLGDVVRTRAYLLHIYDWEAVGRAHREAFGAVLPASSMVGVRELLRPELLVELEVSAIVAGQVGG